MSRRLSVLGMILCHGQEKLGEAEDLYHRWALAGKEGGGGAASGERYADGVDEV
jgi:hypothetical protein